MKVIIDGPIKVISTIIEMPDGRKFIKSEEEIKVLSNKEVWQASYIDENRIKFKLDHDNRDGHWSEFCECDISSVKKIHVKYKKEDNFKDLLNKVCELSELVYNLHYEKIFKDENMKDILNSTTIIVNAIEKEYDEL